MMAKRRRHRGWRARKRLLAAVLAAIPLPAAATGIGIDCDRLRYTPEGKLTPDTAPRRLCEAYRGVALHYAAQLRTVHDALRRALGSLPPPILGEFLDHLATDDRIGVWRPSAAGLAALPASHAWVRDRYRNGILTVTGIDADAWHIRARGCGRNIMDRFVVYYEPGHLKASWTPRTLQAAVEAWYEDDLSADRIPALTTGPSGAAVADPVRGTPLGLRACIDATGPGGYATELPRGALAFGGTLRWHETTRRRREVCPDGQVGGGIHHSARRVNGVWVDSAGNPVADEAAAWTVDWNRCREPRARAHVAALECRHSNGRDTLPGVALWWMHYRETRDPDDPFRIIEMPVQAPVDAPVGPRSPEAVNWPLLAPGETHRGQRHSDSCAGDLPVPAGATVTETPTTETRPCRDVHPRAHLRRTTPAIGVVWRLGTWTQRIDTVRVRYPASWPHPTPDYTVRVVHPPVDACHGTADWSETDTRALACPTGMIGGVTQRRIQTWRMRDWADPARTDEIYHRALRDTGWVNLSNTCRRIYSPQPTWGDSSGDGDRDGSDREGYTSWDVDGDWNGDYETYREAREAGHPNAREVHDNCSSCDGRGDANEDNEGDNGDRNDCFLTTAVTRIRGEADDGPTLATLREFRDGWMATRPDGSDLIRQYYDIAPLIVAAIPPDHPDWIWIGGRINHAVAQIRDGAPSDGARHIPIHGSVAGGRMADRHHRTHRTTTTARRDSTMRITGHFNVAATMMTATILGTAAADAGLRKLPVPATIDAALAVERPNARRPTYREATIQSPGGKLRGAWWDRAWLL